MPKVMGILNATPDSFFSSSRCPTYEKALKRGLKICQEGADIVDVGGESTRPGAVTVEEEEELRRVIPLIKSLKEQSPVQISIDTYKPKVAVAAIEAGTTFINDVSGFRNPEMREVAASYEVDLCVMHMLENPQTMQKNPYYEGGITSYLMRWFENQINLLLTAGIKKERIILDPGIGFGKTVADNLEILHNLPKLKELGFSLLLGVSRKSFMAKLFKKPTEKLLSTTIAMNGYALSAGVDIIRVHDVKEHRSLVDSKLFIGE